MRIRDVMRDDRPGARALTICVYALVYVAVGLFSLQTAYIQTNTAAVWIPSGYGIGFLIVRGLPFWPAVALGSFVVNLFVNLNTPGDVGISAKVLVAGMIASGNLCEAIVGATLARRVAGGAEFFRTTRTVLLFATIVVPLPPLFSMFIGVAASHWGGFVRAGTLIEIMLTWYVANAVGILIFAGPVAVLLGGKSRTYISHRRLEVCALAICLVFVSQAICGIYLASWFRDWPRSYMVIPLLLWASLRFGSMGAMLSVVLVMFVAVIGTMRGFSAFPAETPSQSLIVLQIFLGLLSVTTLLITASLSEVRDLQSGLEQKVRLRTSEVERLMKERDIFTNLVAHDLQSPLYGMRDALHAASDAILEDRVTPPEVVSILSVTEETCTHLAERVTKLLISDRADLITPLEAYPSFATLVSKIAVTHKLRLGSGPGMVQISGDAALEIRQAKEVEPILDGLIDNAARYGSSSFPVEVAAYRHGSNIEILVMDRGAGIAKPDEMSLFSRRMRPDRDRAEAGLGLGLYLASEQASALGGRLSYIRAPSTGATFRLIVPA